MRRRIVYSGFTMSGGGINPLVHGAAVACVNLLGRSWFRLEAQGLEHVPYSGGALIAANHKSFWDVPFLGTVAARVRPVYILAKEELFRNPIAAWLFARMGAVRLRRHQADIGAIKTSLKMLREGRILLMFPEGTRRTGGGLEKFLPGVGYLACKAHVPIVPAYVSDFGRFPGFRDRVLVRFGPPVCAQDDPHSVTEQILDRVRQLRFSTGQIILK